MSKEGLPLGLPTTESRMWDVLAHAPGIVVHRMRSTDSTGNHAYSLLPNIEISTELESAGIQMPDGIFAIAALYCGTRSFIIGDRSVREVGERKVQQIHSGLSVWSLPPGPQPIVERVISVPACEKGTFSVYSEPDNKRAGSTVFLHSQLDAHYTVGSLETGTRSPLFIAACDLDVKIGGMPVKFPTKNSKRAIIL